MENENNGGVIDSVARFYNEQIVNPRVLIPNLKLCMNLTLFSASIYAFRNFGYLLAA